MKRILLIALSFIVMSSSCLASGILTTGTTTGQEKWKVQGIYSSTGFMVMNSKGSFAGLGIKGTYGYVKDLDLFAEYWTGSFVVSDADFSESASKIGIGAKYSMLKISNNDPVDLAGFIELASTTSKNLTWGVNSVGVSASKMIKPQWTVYGVASILLNEWKVKGAKSVSETDSLFGAGVRYEVNKTFSVLGEINRTWLDSDLFQTISIAGEWIL